MNLVVSLNGGINMDKNWYIQIGRFLNTPISFSGESKENKKDQVKTILWGSRITYSTRLYSIESTDQSENIDSNLALSPQYKWKTITEDMTKEDWLRFKIQLEELQRNGLAKIVSVKNIGILGKSQSKYEQIDSERKDRINDLKHFLLEQKKIRINFIVETFEVKLAVCRHGILSQPWQSQENDNDVIDSPEYQSILSDKAIAWSIVEKETEYNLLIPVKNYQSMLGITNEAMPQLKNLADKIIQLESQLESLRVAM